MKRWTLLCTELQIRQRSQQHETWRKDWKTEQKQFVQGDKERNKVEFQQRKEAGRHFIVVFWTWTWKIQVEIHLDSEHWVFCERDDLSVRCWVNFQACQAFTVVWHFEKYPFLLSCWLLMRKLIQLSFRPMKYKVTASIFTREPVECRNLMCPSKKQWGAGRRILLLLDRHKLPVYLFPVLIIY